MRGQYCPVAKENDLLYSTHVLYLFRCASTAVSRPLSSKRKGVSTVQHCSTARVVRAVGAVGSGGAARPGAKSRKPKSRKHAMMMLLPRHMNWLAAVKLQVVQLFHQFQLLPGTALLCVCSRPLTPRRCQCRPRLTVTFSGFRG